jgi:hypothetical protein
MGNIKYCNFSPESYQAVTFITKGSEEASPVVLFHFSHFNLWAVLWMEHGGGVENFTVNPLSEVVLYLG